MATVVGGAIAAARVHGRMVVSEHPLLVPSTAQLNQ
jgi:hypothetical protein